MFKKFYQWYIIFFKKSKFVVVIGSFVALFGIFGSIYGGFLAIRNFSSFIFEDYILRQKLEKINTGINISYLDSIIGKPAITQKISYNQENKEDEPSDLNDYIENIYIHKKYFLQIIVDANDIIAFYSITIRDKDFDIRVPMLVARTGRNPYQIKKERIRKITLSSLINDDPSEINFGIRGQEPFYVVAMYYGRPGFYKYYLFGDSQYGWHDEKDDESRKFFEIVYDNYSFLLKEYEPDLFYDSKNELADNATLRELKLRPNTFGVIDGFKHKDLFKYLMNKGIGTNYYNPRSLIF